MERLCETEVPRHVIGSAPGLCRAMCILMCQHVCVGMRGTEQGSHPAADSCCGPAEKPTKHTRGCVSQITLTASKGMNEGFSSSAKWM